MRAWAKKELLLMGTISNHFHWLVQWKDWLSISFFSAPCFCISNFVIVNVLNFNALFIVSSFHMICNDFSSEALKCCKLSPVCAGSGPKLQHHFAQEFQKGLRRSHVWIQQLWPICGKWNDQRKADDNEIPCGWLLEKSHRQEAQWQSFEVSQLSVLKFAFFQSSKPTISLCPLGLECHQISKWSHWPLGC